MHGTAAMAGFGQFIVALLAAAMPCGTVAADRAPGSFPASGIETAFVVLGPTGPVARVITRAASCPALEVDGARLAMTARAGPGTERLRPTRSTPENSKPSAFPVLTCEATIPRASRTAQVATRPLPLPRRDIRRIVVIGDTGCRLKASDNAWQACNDPVAYPFAAIAAKAAAWHPDAVIHVGDYLYRENPCRIGDAGCAGSPWGYGWDAWQADFFDPAHPLLAAAPWIVVRGNHENCARAGQGWWRLLDPRPLLPGRECNDPADDKLGDASGAYAVPLGGGAQIVVMDLSAAGTDRLKPNDWRIEHIKQTARELATLSRGARFTFAADHYPLFGVAADASGLIAGNAALDPVFAKVNHRIVPENVDVLLAGHIHVWEHVDFGGKQASQFIAGFSGTQEDTVPLPQKLPDALSPAPAQRGGTSTP